MKIEDKIIPTYFKFANLEINLYKSIAYLILLFRMFIN